MDASDLELLRRYTLEGREEAFTELVRRHLGLVFGVAMRILRNRSLAEDAVQATFVQLARQSKGLCREAVLAPWLHEVARRRAIDLLRSERRRQVREQSALEVSEMRTPEVWGEIAPILDDALSVLSPADRAVLIHRFLKGQPVRPLAQALGISEEAAQKRVERALDRLRHGISKRGLELGTPTLLNSLSTYGTALAPVGLAETIVAQVSLPLANSTGVAAGFGAVVTSGTGKLVAAAALVVATAVGVFQTLRAHRLETDLRQVSEARVTEAASRAEAMALAESRASELVGVRRRNAELEQDRIELLRLRGEIGPLRAVARRRPADPGASDAYPGPPDDALTAWRRRAEWYQALAEKLPQYSIPELRLLTEEDWLELSKEPPGHPLEDVDVDDSRIARTALSAARAKAKDRLAWVFHRALRGFAAEHDGRLPARIEDLQAYLMNTNVMGPASAVRIAEGAVQGDILSRYRVVADGRLEDQPEGHPVILEAVAPVDEDFDTVLRVGHGWLQIAGRALGTLSGEVRP